MKERMTTHFGKKVMVGMRESEFGFKLSTQRAPLEAPGAPGVAFWVRSS